MRHGSALWSGWLGTLGAFLTCVGSMVALFAGLFGASAMGAGMAGHSMSGMAASASSSSGSGWLTAMSQFSWPILVISVILLAWGAWHASGTVKWLVGAGMVVLVMDEILMKALHVMVLWLYVPAVLLLIAGNLWAVKERQANLAETSSSTP